MKTKTIITLIGALNVLQGIGFILGGQTLTGCCSILLPP